MTKFAEIAFWTMAIRVTVRVQPRAEKPFFQAQIRKNPPICDLLGVERTKLPDVNWLAESSAALLYSCETDSSGGTSRVLKAPERLSHQLHVEQSGECRRLCGRDRRTFQWQEMPEESCLDLWVLEP